MPILAPRTDRSGFAVKDSANVLGGVEPRQAPRVGRGGWGRRPDGRVFEHRDLALSSDGMPVMSEGVVEVVTVASRILIQGSHHLLLKTAREAT